MLETLAIIIIGIGAGFIVSVISTSGFWSGRIRFSIGALIGFLWIYAWVKTDFAENKTKLNTLLVVTLIAYGLMNTINYIAIMTEHNKVNQLDKQEVLSIQQEVQNYEQQQKIEITKIAVVINSKNTLLAFYPQIKYQGSMVMCSSIKTQWAAAGCYNYYSNSNLQIYKPTNIEKQRFLDTEKEHLCMGDTLYIAVYMY